MPGLAILFGFLHIALGGGMYGYLWLTKGAEDGAPSLTALIPAFVGLILVTLGVLGRGKLRVTTMHLAAMVALLALLAAIGRLLSSGGGASAMAVTTLIGMGLLSGVFLFLCIQSFGKARAARKQAQP